jgi:hypothetical protein
MAVTLAVSMVDDWAGKKACLSGYWVGMTVEPMVAALDAKQAAWMAEKWVVLKAVR